MRLDGQQTDPDRLARSYLHAQGKDKKGRLTLRSWFGEFWRYEDDRYVTASAAALTNDVKRFLVDHFERNGITTEKGKRVQVSARARR